MPLFAMIEGQITNKEVFKPTKEGQQVHQKLQILQNVQGEKAVLVDVKDYNLKNEYNGHFRAFCKVSDWSFNGKSGMSASVIYPEAAAAKKGGI